MPSSVTDRHSSPSVRAFAREDDSQTPAATLDLGGAWRFRAVGETDWAEALVPGTVHADLLRTGRIEDPFYRDNELKAQWVEGREWEYEHDFEVAPVLLAADRVMLECRGLDTIAELTLNGRPLAKTINMWIEYAFDVKSRLRPGINTLRIVFRSPLAWSEAQRRTEPKAKSFCRPGSPGLDARKGLSFWLRKEACSFGWDWAPRLVGCGIWKAIRLAAYEAGRIEDVSIGQDLTNPKSARLTVETQVALFAGEKLQLEIEVKLKSRRIASAMQRVSASERIRTVLEVPQPKLWWPQGWGRQPLYTVTFTLRADGRVAHEQRRRIGLRTVELLREKDARGEGFAFRVNGRVLAAKGANWVPLDALPGRLTEAHYRRMLDAARDANFNMLRIWGGGRYEADVFYEACDERGLLVWHDFMFAVGPYIANAAYVANVRSEISNVVRRLRHHPCIALWCGNNESESNMTTGHAWTKHHPTATWAEYDAIFHRAIPREVAKHDPARPYWPSSPHHPRDRAKRGADWEGGSGNAHSWKVWHEAEPFSYFERFSRMRFVTEFGFESLPPTETIRAFTAPADRRFNSYVLDHHEKAGVMKRSVLEVSPPDRGSARLARYVAGYYPMPGNLEEWVYITQLMHGEGLRVGVEAVRRAFPSATGVLFWQFGDIWPVTSYASVDYHGRWKGPQYFARRFFNPVLVGAEVKDTAVTLWASNDGLNPMQARLEWRLARFDNTIVERGETTVSLAAGASKVLARLSFPQVAEDPAHATYRNDSFANTGRYYLWYQLRRDLRVLSANAAFFAPAKYLQLPDPALRVTWRRRGDRHFASVSSRAFAAFVELSLRRGYAQFSDNFFHLLPGEVREVEVTDATTPLAAGAITVRSLALGR